MSTASTHTWCRPAMLLCALLLAACDSGPAEPRTREITVVTGDEQIGKVNATLNVPLWVRVTDAQRGRIPEVSVRWRVEEGGGSLVHLTTTASNRHTGHTSNVYTLGAGDGINRVTASLGDGPGAPQVTFTARAVTEVITMIEDGPDYYSCFYYGTNCTPAFSPSVVTVPTGKTVLWAWSSAEHNVTFEDDPTAPVSKPTQRSGIHIRKFTEAGTYRFRCTIHSTSFTQGEVGMVRVQQG